MSESRDYGFSVSNEELLELCKRQDQEALRVLLKRHERPVYSLLLRMLSNREDAEEALADVFVKVWRGAASFKGESKFTTWLFRIAANTARDRLRSRMTRHEVSIEDTVGSELAGVDTSASKISDPEKQTIDSEERARIIRAMSGLSEEDRLLVNLYHIQELDYEQISQITGTSASNLKVKLFRARQRLKRLCEDMEKDGSANEMREDSTGSSGLQQGDAEWA